MASLPGSLRGKLVHIPTQFLGSCLSPTQRTKNIFPQGIFQSRREVPEFQNRECDVVFCISFVYFHYSLQEFRLLISPNREGKVPSQDL